MNEICVKIPELHKVREDVIPIYNSNNSFVLVASFYELAFFVVRPDAKQF